VEVPLAHVGHWWMYPLYGLPLVIVLASVVISLVRERRGGGSGDGP
jgi:hypothetical protein